MTAGETKPMELRARIERTLAPMVQELRSVLAKYPTVLVLNHYLGKAHAIRMHDIEMPDVYWSKFRYMWAILLSLPWKPYDGVDPDDLNFPEIDQRIEDIFYVYRLGAIYDPGKMLASRREFIARMGWAIRVFEPDVLAFPEQIRDWAVTRFTPFDNGFFFPRFGNLASDIFGGVTSLIETVGDRSERAITEGCKVQSDLEVLRDRFIENPSDIESIREDGKELQLEQRLVKNAQDIADMHIFTKEELRSQLSTESDDLISLLAIKPGDIPSEFKYPHDESPLEFKSLVALPDGSYFFLDPANAYRLVAKALERQILEQDPIKGRYLSKRDKLTEEFVAARLKTIFPEAEIHQNYYLEKGQLERDILIRHSGTVILVECKNFRVRGFTGRGGDLLKYDNDFEDSVQYAYDQALDVKQRVCNQDETAFLDEKGRVSFSLRRSEITRFFIVCIAITPRGEFVTDLSYFLQKPVGEPYPISINLFDFDTIAKYLKTPEQFLGYLAAREPLHGRVSTGDELNYAGYFYKYGNLDFPDGLLVDETFSAIFDRRWYAEKGIHLNEPDSAPLITTIERRGDRIIVEDPSSRYEMTVPVDVAGFAADSQNMPTTDAEVSRANSSKRQNG